MDKDARRRKADELREYVSIPREARCPVLAFKVHEQKSEMKERNLRFNSRNKSLNIIHLFTSSAVDLCSLFSPHFRSNKDDGKKNEERTGVKKKGEYYVVNI